MTDSCHNIEEKIMKKTKLLFATIVLSLLAIASCDKDELDISQENVLGQWVEDYSDYPYFATEGYITYNFNADGLVDIHVYDVFAGDSVMKKTYTVAEDYGDGKDVLMINPHMSDYSGEYYKIVKLTKNVMEWQRVGTSFQKGTVGSDFKHLIRKRQ